MAVQFPQSPSEGDRFHAGSYVYIFEDGKWSSAALSDTVPIIVGATGPQGSTGPTGPVINIESLPTLP